MGQSAKKGGGGLGWRLHAIPYKMKRKQGGILGRMNEVDRWLAKGACKNRKVGVS